MCLQVGNVFAHVHMLIWVVDCSFDPVLRCLWWWKEAKRRFCAVVFVFNVVTTPYWEHIVICLQNGNSFRQYAVNGQMSNFSRGLELSDAAPLYARCRSLRVTQWRNLSLVTERRKFEAYITPRKTAFCRLGHIAKKMLIWGANFIASTNSFRCLLTATPILSLREIGELLLSHGIFATGTM